MKKVKLTKEQCIDGKLLAADTVLEFKEAFALQLIAAGLAEAVEEGK